MSDILDRILGYSNEEMVKNCMLLRDTMLSHKEKNKKKTGFVFNKDVYNRILRSIDHYSKTDSFELRDYQKEIIEKGGDIIREHGFLYLAMEVRTGKTLISLGICNELFVENVLFITKKKAISSITDDYAKMGCSYALEVTNYENLHNLEEKKWDVIIIDEAHSIAAFPKPSIRAKQVKELIKSNHCMVILLSGTPTPESYSQMYHQVYGIEGNPFSKYTSFYKFAHDYVDVKDKRINGFNIRDYSHGKDSIIEAMDPYTINYTQIESGFVVETTEEVLYVPLKESTYKLIKQLQKDLVIEGKNEIILADTAVKLMTKTHQLFSGTIKFESGNSMIIDMSKADFIRERFKGKKIGIFYKFKEELKAILQSFGDDITTELSVFKDTDKSIALQIVSGREGISLKQADCLVYYNIDFSATSYWQSRDRMTTKDRLKNKIYWIFAEGGIEGKIYKAVVKKKDYTLRHFKKDFEI